MAPSAHDIAAAIRQREPAVGRKKLHKLLYYAQGHHLAVFGRPLFAETISAYDMGPVVTTVWAAQTKGRPAPEPVELGEAELNTVGYVLHRYGALSGGDLERLSHAEDPWRLANAHRRPGQSAPIDNSWIRDWFTGPGAPIDEDEEIVLDAAQIADMLAGARERLGRDLQADTREALEARVAAERG